MIVCPNKATPEWKLLLQKAGSEDFAYDVFVRNGYELPTLKELESLQAVIAKPINTDEDSIKKLLYNTGFFRGGPDGTVYTKKNYYGPALAAAKDYEAVTGLRGLFSFVKEQTSASTYAYRVVVNNGQQTLFDLPSQERPSLLIPGFKSFEQQKEVVDVMASSVLAFMRDNPDVKAGTFKKAVQNFKEAVEPLATAQPDSIFGTILNNLDALSEQAKYKLQRLNLIARPKLSGTNLEKKIVTEETKEEEEGVEEAEAIGDFNDSWVFQYDSKDNALNQVKQFLAFIPRTEYDKETQKFKLVKSVVPGQPSFMSYDEVYEQLKVILAGVENTWEAMEAELKNYTTSKPFIASLFRNINTYKGDIERLKSQFVSTMSSSYSGHKTILIKDVMMFDPTTGLFVPTGRKLFNIIDTDQGSVQKVILNNWKGNLKQGNFYEKKDGEYVVNKKAIEAYLNKIQEEAKNPTKEGIANLLDIIGISISPETLDALFAGQITMPLANHFTDASGLFKLISIGLQQTDTEEDIDIPINPLGNSAVRELAKIESRNTDYYYSNTFRDVNNNTVYSYTFNKFLTKEFNKIKDDPTYVSELLDITFNKPIIVDDKVLYNTWLNKVKDNKIFRESVLNIAPLDGTRIVDNSRSGTKLTSMSEFDQEITRLALFTNSGNSKRGAGEDNDSRVMQYLLTIPSKSTSYAIQGTALDTKITFNPDGSYNFLMSNVNALYAVFMSEYNRAVSQSKRNSGNKAYNTGSQKVFFFPTLLESIKNPDGTFKLPTDKLESGKTVERDIKEKLVQIVKKDVEAKIKDWKDLGIVKDNQLDLVDSKYLSTVVNPLKLNEQNKITYVAADYVLNNILAKFNVHQLFIDDPAVYYKSSEKETWDNIGKRLTNLIAPSKDGRITPENEWFVSIKLNDFETSALNAAQLKGRIGKYYEDRGLKVPYQEETITGTDAQEFVTLREELAVAKMYGEIPTDLYNKLMKQLETDPDNIVLNSEELDLVFSARKPVYSSRVVSKQDDVIYREYIKTASVVLLPQFTKGLEIDKLRVAMEALETSGKYKGKTVRAAFKSGVKLGGKKFADIWNKDGTIKAGLDLTENSELLDRHYFGIQQEVPYDPRKNEVVRSTQVLKLLFDSLDDVENFRYEGKYYTGKQLKEKYSNLVKQVYESGLASLESRILLNNLLNIPKVTKLLKEEGIKRGYNPAQLSFLETNPEGTDFALPFWSHINNDKEQAMLMSLWTNNVLRQKMPGGSYVLVSEEGMQGKSIGVTYVGDNKTQVVDKTEEELLTQVLPQQAIENSVTVSATDPETGEEYLEEEKAGKAVKDLQDYIAKLDSLIKCLNA